MLFQDEIEKVEKPAIEQLTQLGRIYILRTSIATALPVDGGAVGERAID